MNVTYADCLITTKDIGGYVVHDICTGATIDIPLGLTDWAQNDWEQAIRKRAGSGCGERRT